MLNFLRRFHSSPRFLSYSAALEASDGYESPDLVRVVHEKTKRYRDSKPQGIFPDILFGQNVLDFGGACGAHYFLARTKHPNLHWHVVETPAMVREAKDLEDGQLRFFDNLAEAKKELGWIDLLFTSGAIQYVPDPYQTLEELLSCQARFIFFTRLPLADEDIISVQKSKLANNGPGPLPPGFKNCEIRYPITFMAKEKFEALLRTRYEIRSISQELRKAHWAGKWISMFGYLAELSTAPPNHRILLLDNCMQ